MNDNLVGKKIIITNPVDDHRWLRGMTGKITKADTAKYIYVADVKVPGTTYTVRLVRGEFEEVIE